MTTALRPPAGTYAPPASPAAAATACLDCDTPLAGHYCHECGARRADERPLTVARFRNELIDEVSSPDSLSFRTLRTLLAEPGRLTVEYLAGRTRRWPSPLRLYLLLFGALTFLSGAFDLTEGARQQALKAIDERQSARVDAVAARHAHAGETRLSGTATEEISKRTFEYAFNPWLRLVDPAVIAVLLGMLYRGRRQGYAPHLVFALHLMAANAVVSIGTVALHDAAGWAGPMDTAATAVHWTLLGLYFFAAARMVHAESRARTAMKTVGFVVGSQAAAMVVPFLAAAVATVQVLL